METQEQQTLLELLEGQRWAALASYDGKKSYASYVAYVPEAGYKGFLIHISQLAPHTRFLQQYPDVSLAISQPDVGVDDPQTLARVSIQGKVVEITRDDPDYPRLKEHYIQRLPQSRRLFDFGDFILFRLVPQKMRYVAGFGRTMMVSPDSLVISS